MYQNKMYRHVTTIPLDIMFHVPKKVFKKKVVKPGQMERENILKNVIFRRVMEIRD